MKIVIKSSFLECIERIVYFDKSEPNKTKYIILDNTSPKQEIIEASQKCIGFLIEDGYISFEVYKTEEEIQKEKEYFNKLKTANIPQLKKWYNRNEDNKNQIETYLLSKNLNWILDELK